MCLIYFNDRTESYAFNKNIRATPSSKSPYKSVKALLSEIKYIIITKNLRQTVFFLKKIEGKNKTASRCKFLTIFKPFSPSAVQDALISIHFG